MAILMNKTPLHDSLQSVHDHTKEPRNNLAFYLGCAERLKAAGVLVSNFCLDLRDFNHWLANNPNLHDYYKNIPSACIQKCLEHYLTELFSDIQHGKTVIDIAASGSPWAAELRAKGVNAYRLDLAYSPGINGYDIGANAAHTDLSDSFADALTLHCAYECFQGTADIAFLGEAARLLKPGGTVAITPLYLDDFHFVVTCPDCPLPDGAIEPEARILLRDDPWKVPFSRHYSPESFAMRIFDRLPAVLQGQVIFLENLEQVMDFWPDQVLYAFFTFTATKQG